MTSIDDIRHVLVIGTGMMGPGIALSLARAGFQLEIFGRTADSLARGRANLDLNCARLLEYGLAAQPDLDAAQSRIRLTSNLSQAAAQAHLIVESIAEDLPAKQQFFRELCALCAPDALLTSNTSGLPITRIAEGVTNPERFAGTHYWNPPYLMPLVEVIKGRDTASVTFDTVCAVVERSGKRPVRVLKDVPGFLGNRLQHALQREALALVENGVATPADVDVMIKYSFALRMPPLGVFEHMDLVGLDLASSVQSYLFADLDNRATPSPEMEERMRAGKMGAKAGEGFYRWTPRLVEERKRLRDAGIARGLQHMDEDVWDNI